MGEDEGKGREEEGVSWIFRMNGMEWMCIICKVSCGFFFLFLTYLAVSPDWGY